MEHPTEIQFIEHLDEGPISWIEEHLASCLECQQEFQEIRWIFQETPKTAFTPTISLDAHKAILEMIYPRQSQLAFRWFSKGSFAAAAILLFGALGFALFFFQSNEKNNINMASQKEILTPEKNSQENKEKTSPYEAPKDFDFVKEEKEELKEKNEEIEKNIVEEEKSEPKQQEKEKLKEEKAPEKESKEILVPKTQQKETLIAEKEKITEEKAPEKESKSLKNKLLCGDLNENGELDAADTILLMRKIQTRQSIPLALGDLNLDGQVNILDAQTLCKQIVNT